MLDFLKFILLWFEPSFNHTFTSYLSSFSTPVIIHNLEPVAKILWRSQEKGDSAVTAAIKELLQWICFSLEKFFFLAPFRNKADQVCSLLGTTANQLLYIPFPVFEKWVWSLRYNSNSCLFGWHALEFDIQQEKSRILINKKGFPTAFPTTYVLAKGKIILELVLNGCEFIIFPYNSLAILCDFLLLLSWPFILPQTKILLLQYIECTLIEHTYIALFTAVGVNVMLCCGCGFCILLFIIDDGMCIVIA